MTTKRMADSDLERLAKCEVTVVAALAQRALAGIILYATYVALTNEQRDRIGPLSDEAAQRVLWCANCVAWLETMCPEKARCGSCGRQWRASESTKFVAARAASLLG